MLRYLREPNILFGSALSILGAYIVLQSNKWMVYDADGPGPGFFPLIYGLIMLVFSLILLTKTVKEQRVAVRRAGREPAPARGDDVAAFATWLALAASVPLMWAFGFIIGFGLVLFTIIKVAFERPWLNAAITAALVVIGLQVLFAELLESPLPTSAIWGF